MAQNSEQNYQVAEESERRGARPHLLYTLKRQFKPPSEDGSKDAETRGTEAGAAAGDC